MWLLVDYPERIGNLAFPGSYCPSCNKALSAIHLIPLVSYIVQRGRCTHCDHRISWRYPVVEILGGVAVIIALNSFGLTINAGAAAIYFWFLITLGFIDHETGYLPNALTLPLVGLGLVANAVTVFVPFMDALIGAVAGYGAFWAISTIFKKIRGIDGLGLGDAKLLAAIGAWTGWQMLSPTVFAGSVIALVGIGLVALRGEQIGRTTQMPFGPALAIAGAGALLFR